MYKTEELQNKILKKLEKYQYQPHEDLFQNNINMSQDNKDYICKNICRDIIKSEDKKLIEYVYGFEQLKTHIYKKAINPQILNKFCRENKIDFISYIVNDSPMKEKIIREDILLLIKVACNNDKIDIMELMLENKILNNNKGNPDFYRYIINRSCEYNYERVINYIFNSTLFKPYINHLKLLEIAVDRKNDNLINYIMTDKNLVVNKQMKIYMDAKPDIKLLYEKIKFKSALEHSLKQNPILKKMKI